MKIILGTIASIALALPAGAAIIQFDLQGTAGFGLLPGNEPGSIGGGTGGEIGAGISYDDILKQLTLNVGWGSSQGFTDLSSASNNAHIHVTANNFGNGGAGNFTQTGGVVISLTRSSALATGGIFTGQPITLTAPQEADLLNTKYYINIHTATNGGGEMRGFLTQVPEPSSLGLLALGLTSLTSLRRRKANAV